MVRVIQVQKYPFQLSTLLSLLVVGQSISRPYIIKFAVSHDDALHLALFLIEGFYTEQYAGSSSNLCSWNDSVQLMIKIISGWLSLEMSANRIILFAMYDLPLSPEEPSLGY